MPVLLATLFRALISLYNRLKEVYLDIELGRYRKQLLSLVIYPGGSYLLSLHGSNALHGKLVAVYEL